MSKELEMNYSFGQLAAIFHTLFIFGKNIEAEVCEF